MSELQNPLFEEEKEFLERKKLEYERALRGDVDHIKAQSVKVGKVALVGVGLAGGIWLITKAFSSKKQKRHTDDYQEAGHQKNGRSKKETDHNEAAQDDEFGTGYFTSGNGKRYESSAPYKSAADSASAFVDHHEQTHESDDLGFGSTAATRSIKPAETTAGASPYEAKQFDADYFEDDPFQDLPYDDSRRLPISHAFDDDHTPVISPWNARSRLIGSLLQAFLQSDTGKVLVAQVAAVALALVTKKVGEFFPADKNSDLSTSPGHATAETGVYPVASSAPSVFPDAHNPPQSI